jgi:hypothetical protein
MKGLMSILILLIISSCNDKRSLNFGEDINYFDDGFIDHFPKKIRYRNSYQAISQNISISHPYVWLKYYPDQTELDSIKNSAKAISIAVYDSEDICLVVIDKHLTSQNWIKYDKKIRNPKKLEVRELNCQEGKYPVPNFFKEWICETNLTLTKLEGYKMYVLESEKGIYMNPEKLPNGVYTPKGWEHGYSKGVAINNETGAVIYWADIW